MLQKMEVIMPGEIDISKLSGFLQAFARAADAAVDIVEHGMDHAMNQFN